LDRAAIEYRQAGKSIAHGFNHGCKVGLQKTGGTAMPFSNLIAHSPPEEARWFIERFLGGRNEIEITWNLAY
jgi:hypothetical protein